MSNQKMVKMQNFFIWIQTERFDTSNFELDKPLPKEKNKNVTGLVKDELAGQIMEKFVGLRAKTYTYLKDNNDEDKNTRHKKSIIK